MTEKNIRNVCFELVESTLEEHKTVRVVFTYEGKKESYFIFVRENKNSNYIAQAKKQFYQDLKSGEVERTLKLASGKSNCPWLKIAVGVLGVAAIVFAALFTYKMLQPNEGGDVPPVPSNYATITLDAGEGNTLEGTEDKTLKHYVKKGSTFADVFNDLHCIGGVNKEKDFLYWSINSQPISEDYVINEDIKLDAVYKPIQTGCLTFTAREDNLSLTFIQNEALKMSLDHETWNDVPSGVVTLEHAGDQIYIKRENEASLVLLEEGIISSSNKVHSISGPIESLVNGKTSGLGTSTFKMCFSGDYNLVTAHNLNLTNVTLVDGCFYSLFYDCSSLILPPALPATTLAARCYSSMFQGCSSLTVAPNLPATTLANSCYQLMFDGCLSLTEVPTTLPATTLITYCYEGMFNKCISLTKAPEMLAESFITKSCDNMFFDCLSLKVNENGPGTKIFTCTSAQRSSFSNIFTNTAGTFTGTPTTGKTYYYY